MAAVVVVDETVVVVPSQTLLTLLTQRSRWVVWWPGSVATMDRRGSALTWALSGALVGTSSVELCEGADGVLVRYTLEADPAEPGAPTVPRRATDSPHGRREAESLSQRHRVAWKRSIFALVSEYETTMTGRLGR